MHTINSLQDTKRKSQRLDISWNPTKITQSLELVFSFSFDKYLKLCRVDAIDFHCVFNARWYNWNRNLSMSTFWRLLDLLAILSLTLLLEMPRDILFSFIGNWKSTNNSNIFISLNDLLKPHEAWSIILQLRPPTWSKESLWKLPFDQKRNPACVSWFETDFSFAYFPNYRFDIQVWMVALFYYLKIRASVCVCTDYTVYLMSISFRRYSFAFPTNTLKHAYARSLAIVTRR